MTAVEEKLTAILDALVTMKKVGSLGVLGASSDVDDHAADTFVVIDELCQKARQEIETLVGEVRELLQAPAPAKRRAVKR